MGLRPLTEEYDLQRANMHVDHQRELLKSLEAAPFMEPANFAEDVFLKGLGTSIFFIGANKDELLARFGLNPEEEFSQGIMMTSMVNGKRNYEVGKVMFERHGVQLFKSPTMETEVVDIIHFQDGEVNPVARIAVIEHALGDVVFTEMRASGTHLDPDHLKGNIEAMHTMLCDARTGPVTYDMDAKEVTRFNISGHNPEAGQG